MDDRTGGWRAITLCAVHLRAGAYCLANQSLSQRPYGTGHALAISDNRLECVQNKLAIRIGNNEGRQQFDRMTRVTSHLAEYFMLSEEWNRDELTEQPLS